MIKAAADKRISLNRDVKRVSIVAEPKTWVPDCGQMNADFTLKDNRGNEMTPSRSAPN